MEADRTGGDGGGGEPTEEEVCAVLARYDIGRHPRLAALYSIAAYPHIRRCAVLVPLFVCPRDGLFHVLLTQRAASLSSHASVVAFPGGRQDPSDLDDVHTALREAQEEIGLDPSHVRVIARVPPTYVNRSNAVFPVIAFIPPDFKASPNAAEVQHVFSVPLQHFVDRGRVSATVVEVLGKPFRVHSLWHEIPQGGGQFNVWGFTCDVCVSTARALLCEPRSPSRRRSFTQFYVDRLAQSASSSPAGSAISQQERERTRHGTSPGQASPGKLTSTAVVPVVRTLAESSVDGQEKSSCLNDGATGNSRGKEGGLVGVSKLAQAATPLLLRPPPGLCTDGGYLSPSPSELVHKSEMTPVPIQPQYAIGGRSCNQEEEDSLDLSQELRDEVRTFHSLCVVSGTESRL